MSKQLLFVLLITFFVHGCRKANTTDPLSKRLSKEQALEDLSVFSNVLKAAHPSLYLYMSEKRLNELLDNIGSSITTSITLHDLYNKLSYVVNEIGCSHTDIDMPDIVYDTLNNRKFFFPYPVLWIDNKLIVNATGYKVPAGAEIRSINGLAAKTVIENLMVYNSIEGRHRNTQRELAADRFAIEYFFQYGTPVSFELEVKDTTGSMHIVTENPIKLATWRSRYNNDRYYYDRTDVDYDFYFIPKYHNAYLKISTFSFSTENKESAFEDFCANAFELLKYKKSVKSLIIDLRENTGGRLYNAFLLYSYLAKKPFKEYEGVTCRTNSIPYAQYLNEFAEDNKDSINNEMSRFTKRSPDYYYTPDSLINTWKPDKNHFDGIVYIITNSKMMSSATYFALLVKNSGVGKIVGETTTGGPSSGNGYKNLEYILPNSHIKLYFPYAHLTYTYKAAQDEGMGLNPDYFVPDDYESFKNNSDRQYSFIVDSLILN